VPERLIERRRALVTWLFPQVNKPVAYTRQLEVRPGHHVILFLAHALHKNFVSKF
jgi:hypothetical protein